LTNDSLIALICRFVSYTANAVTQNDIKDLRSEASALKEAVAELRKRARYELRFARFWTERI